MAKGIEGERKKAKGRSGASPMEQDLQDALRPSEDSGPTLLGDKLTAAMEAKGMEVPKSQPRETIRASIDTVPPSDEPEGPASGEMSEDDLIRALQSDQGEAPSTAPRAEVPERTVRESRPKTSSSPRERSAPQGKSNETSDRKLSPDAKEAKEDVRNSFFTLAEEVRSLGVEPNELPGWNKAHRAMLRGQKLAQEFDSASTDEERRRIQRQFQANHTRLTKSLSEEMGAAAQEIATREGRTSPRKRSSASESTITRNDAPMTERNPLNRPAGKNNPEDVNSLGLTAEETAARRAEHAIAEPDPNSKAERRAKMEALFEKYGPKNAASAKAETKVPTFASPEGLDGNFTYTPHREIRVPMPGKPETAPATAAEALDRAKASAAKAESNSAFRAEHSKLDAEVKHREQYYFSMLRRHQRERGFWGATMERMGLKKGGGDKGTPSELRELKRGVMEARAAQARHMLGSMEARREARGAKRDENAIIEKGPHKGRTYGEVMRERYQNMFVVKEAVFGFENAEQKARIDGLRARDRGIVDKTWKWYSNLSPKQKIMLSAPFLVTAGAAALFGGLWPAGIVAGMGATAARLNWVAENRREKARENRGTSEKMRGDKLTDFAPGYDARADKHERAAQRYNTAAKWVTFAGIGGMIGAVLNRNANKEKLERANRRLAREGKTGNGVAVDLSKKEDFDYVMAQRAGAAATKGKIENQEKSARAAGALIGGAAGGAALGAAFHHFDHGGLGGGEASPSYPGGDPIAEAHHGFTAVINRHGEGADLLYKDLHDQLAAAYKGHTPPPVVAEILKYKNMDQFSQATGFEHVVPGADLHGPHGHIDSAVMHMGDKFVISPDGRSFSMIDAAGNHNTLLTEAPVSGTFASSHEFPMRDYSHQAHAGEQAPQASPDAAPGHGDARGDAQVADLNKAAQMQPQNPPAHAAEVPPNVPPRTFGSGRAFGQPTPIDQSDIR